MSCPQRGQLKLLSRVVYGALGGDPVFYYTIVKCELTLLFELNSPYFSLLFIIIINQVFYEVG